MRVSKADGLLGNLGMYNVEINGRTQVMSRQELDNLQSCPASPAAGAQGDTHDLKNLAGAHPSAYAQVVANAKQPAGAVAAGAPIAPARTTPAADHPVVKEMLNVVEQVYSHRGFAHIDAAGSQLQRTIASEFVRLGEMAQGGPCSVNANREQLFMLGAHVAANLLNLQQPLAAAASRGSDDRQAHDAKQTHMWADGSISTQAERTAYLQRAEVQRMLQTLHNITGGLGGALGYAAGGDKGSDLGATWTTC